MKFLFIFILLVFPTFVLIDGVNGDGGVAIAAGTYITLYKARKRMKESRRRQRKKHRKLTKIVHYKLNKLSYQTSSRESKDSKKGDRSSTLKAEASDRTKRDVKRLSMKLHSLPVGNDVI
ncbi:CLUMA_CG003481, isoform A [Clunio marinus]|uniref:CLUMA_CG003481, isoform A n=1 Tax=Clunio marinus TaxID=568069 RepID=A0A1J1HNT9_9DIPT|nr:CLUMA_CG003481, isoform A [Clunio marinus]